MRRRRTGEFAQSIQNYFESLDKVLIFLSLVLSAFGVVVINSATGLSGWSGRYVIVQICGIALGLFCVFVLSKVDYAFFGQFSVGIVIVCFLLLLFTALFAESISGNKNWLPLGPISIQPSELTKVAFVLTFSTHVANVKDRINRFPVLLFLMLHFAAYFIPILLQGDFGSALIYLGILIVILYLAGLHYRWFLLAGILAVFAAPVLWNFVLKDYHKKRILFSFNPELDPLDFGYQPILSRITIGSGELTGMGYGNGVQSQNDLLPARHTDFIYAIVGEDFGFIGCIFVLLLLCAIIVAIARNAKYAKDDAGALICHGLAAMFAVQMVINIGMCIGVSPVIGVTLPFVSAGGSSILSSFLAVGLAESVRMKPDLSLRFGSSRRTRRF